MAIISDWIITHDGVTYPAGKVIFDLPEKLQKQFIADGNAREVPVVPAAPVSGQIDVNDETADDDDDLNKSGNNGNGNDSTGEDDDILTPEEFAKLSAPEQKKELEEIGIEPDSNAPGRLAQYTAWYDQTENE